MNGSHQHNIFRLDLCSHSVVQKSNFWVSPYWDRIVIYSLFCVTFLYFIFSFFCNKTPFPLQNQGKTIVNVSVLRCFPKWLHPGVSLNSPQPPQSAYSWIHSLLYKTASFTYGWEANPLTQDKTSNSET